MGAFMALWAVDNVHKVDIKNRFCYAIIEYVALVLRPGVRFCVDRRKLEKKWIIHCHYD